METHIGSMPIGFILEVCLSEISTVIRCRFLMAALVSGSHAAEVLDLKFPWRFLALNGADLAKVGFSELPLWNRWRYCGRRATLGRICKLIQLLKAEKFRDIALSFGKSFRRWKLFLSAISGGKRCQVNLRNPMKFKKFYFFKECRY